MSYDRIKNMIKSMATETRFETMTEKERITEVLTHLQITPSNFARSIGHISPQRLYQVIHGRNGISERMANEIVTAYPHLNFRWILLGEGDMFNEGMENYTVAADRVKRVMEHFMLSETQFAELLGEDLKEIEKTIKDNVAPSAELQRKILSHFPNLNPEWLIHNEGSMLSDGETAKAQNQPGMLKFYSSDLMLTEGLIDDIKPEMIVPSLFFPQCDYAFTVYGSSMEPLLHSGDIVICKKVKGDIIVFGETYLVETRNLKLLGILTQKESDEDTLVVKSNVPGKKAAEMKRDQIENLYIVRGRIDRGF
jgi:hypothetical protein